MLFRLVFCLVLLGFLGGCKHAGTITERVNPPPEEKKTGYGYIPLDGLAVEETFEAQSCSEWIQYTIHKTERSSVFDLAGDKVGENPYRPLLKSLPDISIRFAVASIDRAGGLTFGPAQFTIKDQFYRAVLDYVNVDAIPITTKISAIVDGKKMKLTRARSEGSYIQSFAVEVLAPKVANEVSAKPVVRDEEDYDLVTLPVYVGIGMRVTADVTALETGVPLVSMAFIGGQAQANRLAGTITLQTIGITGETVASSLPLPSKLDQTTIENAILSIGSNRTGLYKSESTANSNVTTTPRVVGIYSPVGSEPALISAIYSQLSLNRPRWARPCKPVGSPS